MSSSSRICIPRRLDLRAVALGVAALLVLSEGALAQDAPVESRLVAASQRYALEPAPLKQTLEAIAQLSGRRVVFDERQVSGHQAAAVSGLFSARQAVDRALAGSGLEVTEDAGAGLKVGPANLERVLVTAQRDKAETSFRADRSDTATRSGTDLSDVPQAVTIITSKVLETQQALSVRDALANVSGLAFTQSPQGSPTFSIRGYGTTASTVNGVNDASATLSNIFTVERIEVLKGPQAILAGADALGGGVNVVTKKPQAAPLASLLLQYGTYGDATIAGDVTGALTDDKKLSYRLIAADTQARDSAAGFDGRKDQTLLPQLRWKDERTDLIVGLSYGKQHEPPPEYTFARRDGLIMPTPSLRPGNPGDGFDTEEKRAFYQLEQKLTPNITVVSRLQRTLSSLELHLFSPSGLSYDKGAANNMPNGKITYYVGDTITDERATAGDHYLRIDGDTGPISHKLSIGVNHANHDMMQTAWSGKSVKPMVYPPDTSFSFPDLIASSTELDMIYQQADRQTGVFAQDLMGWGDWNLLLNLRRTHYTLSSTVNFVSANFISSDPPLKVSSTTPGVGLVYKLTPNTSLYASYAEGFSPQSGMNCASAPLPPIATKNKELGAKFDFLDNKLALTMAAFQLAQSNSIAYDPVNHCYNVKNSQVTRGFEADLQGELAPGWSALVNYTFNTLHDVSDPTRIFPGLAKNKMSLWTTYQMQSEAWKAWGFGLGFNASTSSPGTYDTKYPFTIPAQFQLDASLFYQRDKWNATFGIKNITDKQLYGVSTSNSYVPVLPGRNFMLTVKRDFN